VLVKRFFIFVYLFTLRVITPKEGCGGWVQQRGACRGSRCTDDGAISDIAPGWPGSPGEARR